MRFIDLYSEDKVVVAAFAIPAEEFNFQELVKKCRKEYPKCKYVSIDTNKNELIRIK